MNIKGTRVSLSAFHHRTYNPYMATTEYTPFSYYYTPVSALEGLTIPTDGRTYAINPTTGTVTVSSADGSTATVPNNERRFYQTNTRYVNASPLDRYGLEWIIDFKQIKALNTSLRFDGNYYYYKSDDETLFASMHNSNTKMTGTGEPYQYIGWYRGTNGTTSAQTSIANGAISKTLNLNTTITTHIPKIRLIMALRIESTLYSYRKSLSNFDGDVYPEYYTTWDDPNTMIPFAEKFLWAKDNDQTLYNDLQNLVVHPNAAYVMNANRISAYYSANLSVTKEIGDHVSISFYANNFFNNMKTVHSSTITQTQAMKKYSIWLLALGIWLLAACSEQAAPSVDTSEVSILLTGLDDDLSGLDVQLRNINTGSVFVEKTNAQGIATFNVTPGLYEALTSQTRNTSGNEYYSYNGTSGQITVLANQSATATIPMKRATISRLVIKELYCGGCMTDNGVNAFHYDKYVILYNNSAEPASYDNLCFGMSAPANAQANNNNYLADGRLNYEGEGFTPLWNGIWYFPSTLTIEPYSQIVVNIHGAIDNTQTISQSVNFANADYYCMFDPESGYNNPNYCPTPSEVIPTSHYLKAAVYGLGNAWPLSNSSPSLVLFQTKDVTPADFAQNNDNYWYDGGGNNVAKRCVKVPNNWIIDAIEVLCHTMHEAPHGRYRCRICLDDQQERTLHLSQC